MTFAKPVANLVPGMMSLSVLGHAYKTVPKDWSPKGLKKVSTKDLLGGFTGTMMAVPMIGVVSNQVSALP